MKFKRYKFQKLLSVLLDNQRIKKAILETIYDHSGYSHLIELIQLDGIKRHWGLDDSDTKWAKNHNKEVYKYIEETYN